MQAKVETSIWSAAILISFSIHGALFVNRSNELSTAMEKTDSKKVTTRVTFRIPVPTPETPIEVVAEITEPEPEVEKPEPKPKPKSKPKPKPKPKPKKQPVEKKSSPKKPKPVLPRTVVEEKTPLKNTLPVVRPAIDPVQIEQARRSYLASLTAHIESHRHYPRSARRRRIEGEVQVSFRLLPGGSIDRLEAAGKRKLLSKATRKAVTASLPLPVPSQELGLALPLPINFTMTFVLK